MPDAARLARYVHVLSGDNDMPQTIPENGGEICGMLDFLCAGGGGKLNPQCRSRLPAALLPSGCQET